MFNGNIKRLVIFFFAIQAVSAVAFVLLSGTAYRYLKPIPSTPAQLVASWRWYGMWLPDNAEVTFLRASLPNSLVPLRAGLADSNSTVRRCTAQALEGLGPAAKPLIPNLKVALSGETDQLVRVYFAKAFGPIGDSSPTTIAFLNAAVAKETDADVKSYLQGSISQLPPTSSKTP